MTFRALALTLALPAASPLIAEEDYPPLKSPGETSQRGAALQRTMSLLESSAVEKKNTVRILRSRHERQTQTSCDPGNHQ